MVVALALLGLLLLFTLTLIWLEIGAGRRLAAHREALGALESTLERVRAGFPWPAACGSEAGVSLLPAPGKKPVAEGLRVCSHLEGLAPSGLYRLRLRARYRVGPRPFERQVETYLWRP